MNKYVSLRHLDMLTTAFGLDIDALLRDDKIIEIMVNPDGKLWVESLTQGKYFSGEVLDPSSVFNVIKLVAATRHVIVDVSHPEIACDLPENGARFQGWIPPITKAPTFSIRKKAISIFTLDDYVYQTFLSEKQADFLKKAIIEKKNILISGGTSSGKTTFANALLNELKNTKDRVIVLEDLPELQVAVDDCVTLRTSETKTMRDLVKGILRMRPDRIIIGEVRDGAALELLKSWNTGHPGGICTIHANSPEATISRLEDLILEEVPVVPKRLIHEAIDVVVFMKREGDGKFMIQAISQFDEKNELVRIL